MIFSNNNTNCVIITIPIIFHNNTSIEQSHLKKIPKKRSKTGQKSSKISWYQNALKAAPRAGLKGITKILLLTYYQAKRNLADYRERSKNDD